MKQTIFFFPFMFTGIISFGADRNFQLQSRDGLLPGGGWVAKITPVK